VLDKFSHPKLNKLGEEDYLYEMSIFLSQEGMEHKRRVYNIIDLMGDIGGVLEIAMIMFGILLYPISEHSFILRATKNLFLARTKDTSMFHTHVHQEQDEEYEKKVYNKNSLDKYVGKERVPNDVSKKMLKELLKHYVIHIHTCDSIRLFFANSCFFP